MNVDTAGIYDRLSFHLRYMRGGTNIPIIYWFRFGWQFRYVKSIEKVCVCLSTPREILILSFVRNGSSVWRTTFSRIGKPKIQVLRKSFWSFSQKHCRSSVADWWALKAWRRETLTLFCKDDDGSALLWDKFDEDFWRWESVGHWDATTTGMRHSS